MGNDPSSGVAFFLPRDTIFLVLDAFGDFFLKDHAVRKKSTGCAPGASIGRMLPAFGT
jgi:hypothetical protein